MNELVTFIDDEIKKDSPFGKEKLTPLIKGCDLRLEFINSKKALEAFLLDPGETSLVLLDRDLSNIDSDPVHILNTLAKRDIPIPVIILSQHKATDERFEQDFRKLDKRLDYLLKGDIENPARKEFVKNLISRAIRDRDNQDLVAVVCNTGKIRISWKESGEQITDDISLSYANADWFSKNELPIYPQEIILRFLYEMGKRDSTEINIIGIYEPLQTNHLDDQSREALSSILMHIQNKSFIPLATNAAINKLIAGSKGSAGKIHMASIKNLVSELAKILIQNPSNQPIKIALDELKELKSKELSLPSKFNDALSSFNEQVKEKTKGIVVGNLLRGERGRGKRVYKARIDKITLEGAFDKSESSSSWTGNIESRIAQLEADVALIKSKLNI